MKRNVSKICRDEPLMTCSSTSFFNEKLIILGVTEKNNLFILKKQTLWFLIVIITENQFATEYNI
jgi:hypothetical protein